MTSGELTAIIIAGVSIGAQLYQWWRGKSEAKKDSGDAAESVSNAAKMLIEPLTQRIGVLESRENIQSAQIAKLSKQSREQGFEINELRAGVTILTNQIVALGQIPIYRPSLRVDHAE